VVVVVEVVVVVVVLEGGGRESHVMKNDDDHGDGGGCGGGGGGGYARIDLSLTCLFDYIYPPTHPINRAYELILQKAVNRPRVPIDVHWAFIDKAIAKAKVHILKVCGLHYYYYYYYYYYY